MAAERCDYIDYSKKMEIIEFPDGQSCTVSSLKIRGEAYNANFEESTGDVEFVEPAIFTENPVMRLHAMKLAVEAHKRFSTNPDATVINPIEINAKVAEYTVGMVHGQFDFRNTAPGTIEMYDWVQVFDFLNKSSVDEMKEELDKRNPRT